MTSRTVAVVGASGFVGAALCKALDKFPDLSAVRVTRENYLEMKGGKYDYVINAAMPSKRFWAKQNPQQDFSETVLKTADMIYGWNYGKFVQISTVSARCETETVYGRHKAAAEQLCMAPGNLILRLSAMFSPELSKGALIDILNRQKVFVSGESRYPFASLDFVACWIIAHLEDRAGILELGARNSLTLNEIAARMGETIEFEGPVENQEIQNPEKDFPDAKEVYVFLENMKGRHEK